MKLSLSASFASLYSVVDFHHLALSNYSLGSSKNCYGNLQDRKNRKRESTGFWDARQKAELEVLSDQNKKSRTMKTRITQDKIPCPLSKEEGSVSNFMWIFLSKRSGLSRFQRKIFFMSSGFVTKCSGVVAWRKSYITIAKIILQRLSFLKINFVQKLN